MATPWSSDVPVSMPIPSDNEVGVKMSGFAMTDGGLAHDITHDSYMRLSVPDFAPRAVPREVVYYDGIDDEKPASMEHLS